MLGQFMVVSFDPHQKHDFPKRQARMQQFLNEIGAGIAIPAWFPGDSVEAGTFTKDVLAAVRPTSHELWQFTLLGSALMHWGLHAGKGEPGNQMAEVIDIVVHEFNLPEPDLEQFRSRTDDQRAIVANSLLDPALAYLREICQHLEVEKQTAFVAMPFHSPFEDYYSIYYRPVLEEAGFCAIRAWGGLSSEHYGPLLQLLIKSAGLVLADVTTEAHTGHPNLNVMYEIGSAHAYEKRVIIVVDEADLQRVPANIDEVVCQYSPQKEGWPEEAIRNTVPFILVHLTTPTTRPRVAEMHAALDASGQRIKDVMFLIEARRAAYARATQLFRDGDDEAAERAFSEAIELGNTITESYFFRAVTRVHLAKFVEAEQDLDVVLGRDDLEDTERSIGLHDVGSPGLRAESLFHRGYARQMQGREDEAQEDYARAQDLGFTVRSKPTDA
jgi:tetratricopeptide (TPR) repeat protein